MTRQRLISVVFLITTQLPFRTPMERLNDLPHGTDSSVDSEEERRGSPITFPPGKRRKTTAERSGLSSSPTAASSPSGKKTTSKGKSRSRKKNVQGTKSSPTSDRGSASTSNGKAPFWDEKLKAIYSKCAFPIATDSAASGSSSSSGSSNDSASNSWFSATRTPLPSKSSPKTSWRSCVNFPADSMVSADTLKPPKKRSRDEKLNKTSTQKSERREQRTRKFRMRLTMEQKKTVCDWMGAARFTFNKSLEAVKNKEKSFPLDQSLLRDKFVTAKELKPETYARKEAQLAEMQKLPRPLTKIQARKESKLTEAIRGRAVRKEAQDALGIEVGKFVREHPWLLDTPKCIRYNAVISLVKAHDSNTAKAQAMAERGEKKKHKFKLKYRSRKQPSSWTIEIDKENIKSVKTVDRPSTRHKNDNKDIKRRKWSEVSLFPNFMGGKIFLTEEIPSEEINSGVKITRNRLGHFHMHVPISTSWEDLPKLKPEAERKVVALDPGVRAFQTFYSPENDFGSYATGEHGFANVFKEAEKCDKMVSELTNEKLTYRQRKDLTRSKHRSIERCRNLVNEAHKKVVSDLCKNYDTILLPVFESQNMVKKPKNENDKRRVIGSKTARALLGWKHYEFRKYLASKVVMCGKELVVVTEEYTTQCCGQCGNLNKNLGGSKVYTCKECSFKCGRDENAARNIFLKYLKE